MNKKIAAKCLTVIMTLMLSFPIMDGSTYGGPIGIFPTNLPYPTEKCKHTDAYRTGAQREDSRFVFWSQHQFEYHCTTCGGNFWKDEDY